jgi:hypothetical protein
MKTIKIICVMLLASMLIGCSDINEEIKIKNFPMRHITSFDSLDRPTDSTMFYFPVAMRSFWHDSSGRQNTDTISTKYDSKVLYDMKEPILSSKYLGKEMFRYCDVSWPRIIRLINEGDSVKVIVKIGRPLGIYYGAIVADTKMFKIDKKYWDTLTTLSNNAKMWNPPKLKKGEGYPLTDVFYEGHSTKGYAHLGISFINEKNSIQERELDKYFRRVAQLSKNKVLNK